MGTLELLDYRRRVADMYRRVRDTTDPREAWEYWTRARQRLFSDHPQSPWEETSRAGRILVHFPYDPAWRFELEVEPSPGFTTHELPHSAGGSTAFVPLGRVHLSLDDPETLTVYWLDSYGGGLFLPFRDATNGGSTYGGGRYVLDSAKGADLGGRDDRLIVDFNFSYHPSCVHSPRWSCPLSPPENRLTAAVEAGERLP